MQPERSSIDGLADVGIETGPQTFFAIFLHRIRGDGHDTKVGEAGILAELRQNGEAIQNRQLNVEKNQVRFCFFDLLQGLPPIARLNYLVA